MIHVDPPAETPAAREVRRKGRAWLAKHPDATAEQLPSYWRECRRDLGRGFGDLCGYCAMWTSPGTVDHFITRAKSVADKQPELAYEWSNFRHAQQWINSARKGDVLDPFAVGDGWFAITLPDLVLHVTDACPADRRELARETVRQLSLADDPRVLDQRIAWMVEYAQSGDIGILQRRAPLLAAAVLASGTPTVWRTYDWSALAAPEPPAA